MPTHWWGQRTALWGKKGEEEREAEDPRRGLQQVSSRPVLRKKPALCCGSTAAKGGVEGPQGSCLNLKGASKSHRMANQVWTHEG